MPQISRESAPDALPPGVFSSPLARRFPLLAGVLAFFGPLILYGRTLCPGVYPGDGGELTAAAYLLGVPHPTGYPLFMLLGHGFQKIWPGNPAWSMNVLSAFFGALACLGLYGGARRFFRLLRPESENWQGAVLALATAWAAGVSATFWDQATQTEVYTLFLVFLAGAWWLALGLYAKPSWPRLFALAFWTGLAFLHHFLILITLPFSCMALIAAWHRLAGKRLPKLALAAALFVLPLFGYLYLPLRAQARPLLNWGNPTNFQGLIWHWTGGDYRGVRVLTRPTAQGIERIGPAELPGHLSNRLLEMAQWTHSQIFPPLSQKTAPVPWLALLLAVGAVLGLALLWKKSRCLTLGWLGSLLLLLAMLMLYTIPDIQVYQIPLWLMLLFLAPPGLAFGRELFAAEGPSKIAFWRAPIAAGVLLILAGCAVYGYLPTERGVNKSQAVQAELFTEALWKSLPPDAILFTNADYDIYPLWQSQFCEGKRRDVTVIGANFIFSRWYAAMLEPYLPEGLNLYVGDEAPSSRQRWISAFAGGMLAPALQTGRPVFLSGFFREYTLLAPWFQVDAAGFTPLPLPGGLPRGRLPLLRVTDPEGKSRQAEAQFSALYPRHLFYRVEGRGAF